MAQHSVYCGLFLSVLGIFFTVVYVCGGVLSFTVFSQVFGKNTDVLNCSILVLEQEGTKLGPTYQVVTKW